MIFMLLVMLMLKSLMMLILAMTIKQQLQPEEPLMSGGIQWNRSFFYVVVGLVDANHGKLAMMFQPNGPPKSCWCCCFLMISTMDMVNYDISAQWTFNEWLQRRRRRSSSFATSSPATLVRITITIMIIMMMTRRMSMMNHDGHDNDRDKGDVY